MTIGDDLLGESLMGEDDVDTTGGARRTRPVAIHFDGLTRDFPLDADGHYTSIHPVDSAMQMAMMVARNDIASSPTTGNGLKGLKYLDPKRVEAIVNDEVRICTAQIVARGDVAIDGVRHVLGAAGGLTVFVDYYNERLPGRPRKTASA